MVYIGLYTCSTNFSGLKILLKTGQRVCCVAQRAFTV